MGEIEPPNAIATGRIIASKFHGYASYFAGQFQEHLKKRCESPIEELLASHLMLLDTGLRESTVVYGGLWFPDARTLEECLAAVEGVQPRQFIEIAVFQQVIIGSYRVDFLIGATDASDNAFQTPTPPQTRFVVVECDGHDFHERTKEQAARDKARDRYMQSLNLPVLRFTGSEIWNDPCAVVNEIGDFLAVGHCGGGISKSLEYVKTAKFSAEELAKNYTDLEDRLFGPSADRGAR